MKHLIGYFLIILCIAACNNQPKLGVEGQTNEVKENVVMGEKGYFTDGKSNLKLYEKEIGALDVENSNINVSINDLDRKIKAFLEKNKKDKDNEKRSAIDRAVRKMLFDYNILNNGDTKQKELREFYVKEFLKNGGYDPVSLYEVLKYVKTNKLLSVTDISKITYSLDGISNYFIEKGEISIEKNKKMILEDSRYKTLLEPNISFTEQKVEKMQLILKEIESWNKTKLENPKPEFEFDYSETLNF